jgi:hypothetical protein
MEAIYLRQHCPNFPGMFIVLQDGDVARWIEAAGYTV